MFCKYCGKEIPDDASVCPSCGKSVQEGQPPAPLALQQDEENRRNVPAASGPTDNLAVASLVCGICSILLLPIVLGPLAIIFGAVSSSRVPRESNSHKLAKAGLILGIIGLVLMVIAFILLLSFAGSDFSDYALGYSSSSKSAF